MSAGDNCQETVHSYVTFVCGCCGDTLVVPISCGNRFCGTCNKSRVSRLRKRVRYLMQQVTLKRNDSFKFVTMTIPNMEDPKEQLKILQKSFRRLRQRQYWKSLVKGGCVFYEVKTGSDGLYHIHLHAIVESAYIPVQELSQVWSEVSPGCIVDVRWISNKAIINYITKYTCKSELSLKSQLSASRLLKGVRLFQPFGTWHSLGKSYVHQPYQCPSCEIADWVYVRPFETPFEAMWVNARDPVITPSAIMKQLQIELNLHYIRQVETVVKPWMVDQKQH